MSTTPQNGSRNVQRVDLDPAQQWILHHVMLDRLCEDQAEYTTEPWWAVTVVEKLERGDLSISTFEAWRLQQDLEAYLDEAPERDADETESILVALESSFEAPPRSLRS